MTDALSERPNASPSGGFGFVATSLSASPRRSLIGLLAAMTFIALDLSPLCADENPRLNPATSIAERLAWEMTSWKSIEFVVRGDYEFHEINEEDRPSLYKHTKIHYIETAGGKRFIDVEGHVANGQITHSQGYDDGSECWAVEFDPKNSTKQSMISIGRNFLNEHDQSMTMTTKPDGYREFFLVNEPIHTALAKATYIGETKVAGRDCVAFRFPPVRLAAHLQVLTYHFDKRSAIPIKVDAERTLPDGKTVPTFQWEATLVEDRQGYTFPVKSRKTGFSYGKSDKTVKKHFTINSTYEKIIYDQAFPPSAFKPKAQPGVQVYDSIRRKLSITPDPNAPKEPPKDKGPDTRASATGIAGPARGASWSDWMARVLPAVGVTALLAGIALKLIQSRRH